ncbi:LOW QUALITY PROTEIN: nmrA-like family domain-containing protein 1 [Morus bassanus]
MPPGRKRPRAGAGPGPRLSRRLRVGGAGEWDRQVRPRPAGYSRAESGRGEPNAVGTSRAEPSRTQSGPAEPNAVGTSRAERSRDQPSRTQSGPAEPNAVGTSRAEPSRGEPNAVGTSRAEPNAVGTSRAEPRRAERSRDQPSRAERSRDEPSRAEESRTQSGPAEPSRTQSGRAEPRRAERSRAQPSRADSNRREPRGSGGRVAPALLEDGTLKVCAVMRSPMKEEARGAEVMKVDQDDEPSLELALAGAYRAFVDCSEEKEITQGKQLADLSTLGLRQDMYSGLENRERLTGGWLEVLHFNGKGVVEECFQKVGVPTMTTLLLYFENFISIFKPQKVPHGDTFVLVLPAGDTPVDGMAVEDSGPVVLCLLESPEDYIGQVIGLSMGKFTKAEYAAVLSQMGKTMEASKISPEYKKHGSPAKETAAMLPFYALKPDQNVALTMKLKPEAHTFHQWVADTKAAF